MSPERLALYTTVYPDAQPYLRAWYDSVRQQTDTAFDLWIGLDRLTPADVDRMVGNAVEATWCAAASGESPARIRMNAMSQMVDAYAGVIFVDSDDLLAPSRVATARAALASHDVTACALRLIDGAGRDLGVSFGPPSGTAPETLLPRYNVFGLSNSAYRTATLRRCLPVPDDCRLVDWLLGTRAWVLDSVMSFDPVPRMFYRQHTRNVARVLPPFAPQQVVEATERVLQHYHYALDSDWPVPATHRGALESARDAARQFRGAVSQPATLAAYVEALNRLQPVYVWWWCVAHPALERIWKN